MQHEAVVAGVVEDGVAAAAQDVHGQAAGPAPPQGLADLLLGGAVGEVAGLAPEAEAGVRGEWDAVDDPHHLFAGVSGRP